jgi:hypothetical protein
MTVAGHSWPGALPCTRSYLLQGCRWFFIPPLRDVVAALLVYDTTDADSFQKVKNWVKELRKMVGGEIVLCIAGNKCDLEKQRQVSLADAEGYRTFSFPS